MDLEGIVLSEISQRQKDKSYDITYMWNLKNKINKQNRNRLTNTENKWMVSRQRGVGRMGEKSNEIKKYKLVVTE